MRPRRAATLFASGILATLGLAACGSNSPGGSAGPAASTTVAPHTSSAPKAPTNVTTTAFPHLAGSHVLTLQDAHSYQPKPPPGGGTDDYHCTLVDPHLTTNSFIVASHFFPNSVEVHHAILFEVPPSMAAAARKADSNGKGWTCFGETALPGTGLAQLGQTPWLSAWAPGHGLDMAPAGTGVDFPAGSLVIMQIHYNLLVGHKPVHAKLMLQTVPATKHLKPLHLDLLPAPPDIPCPAGVHGPLCNRAASLVDLGKRFGSDMVGFVNIIEQVCGRSTTNPPAGNTTTCTWGIGFSGHILRVTPHMHLLGAGMKIVLDPGTPKAQTLLDDTHYNFDYQRSFSLPKPVAVGPGDHVQVTCTYSPKLRQELPQLRQLPPRFVTWGDGSSDEMCLAILQWTA